MGPGASFRVAERALRIVLAAIVAGLATVAPGPTAPGPAAAAGHSATIERLAGPDRYATAAAISAATFAAPAPVAYVASGQSFPDALAAGPVAGRTRSPLLLTTATALPDATRAELTRLAPGRIVVLGGTTTVSASVEAELAALTAGGVTRLAGADRFATAAAISRSHFGVGVPVAYVATGRAFPDALAAGPAAAKLGGPVLLVDTNAIPGAVRVELSRLQPKRIVVVGGSTMVSNAVLAALDAYTTGPVNRQAGADRYATAAAVSAAAFGAASTVHLASGLGFADALAGAPAAAAMGGPLLLSTRTWLPTPTVRELGRLDPTRVRLLGSTPSLADSIAAAVAQATVLARVGPHAFDIADHVLQTVPADALAYNHTRLLEIYGTRDATGAFIFRHTDGKWYDHPVGQAQYILNMLRNYRLRPDQQYLDLAIANGNRLLERAVRHGGGIFFPYGMSYVLHGRGTMNPPWYSGMAQGVALSGFVRLHEVTGDPRWMQAAHETFASFKVARQAGKPWFAVVENGSLWFEEYPWVPYDHTFNGHNFATYGLYDYWRVTGSEEARLLTLGGIATAARFADTVRVPGGISHYCVSQSCLDRKVRTSGYHQVHIGQFIQLHRYTRADRFAKYADVFVADNPDYRTGGTAIFEPGKHVGYTFDTTGTGTAVKSTTNSATSNAPYRQRNVPYGWLRPGNGTWLYLSAGYFEGLWVRESAIAYPRGFVDRLTYLWPRGVSVGSGTWTGYQYDADGRITASKAASTSATGWTFTSRARINGRPAVLLASGPLSGYWLPVSSPTGLGALEASAEPMRSVDLPASTIVPQGNAPPPPSQPEDPLIPPPLPGQLEGGAETGPPPSPKASPAP